MKQGEVIFIEINNRYSTYIQITASDEAYSWFVNDQQVSGDLVETPRGTSFSIGMIIGNLSITEFHYTSYDLSVINNTVYVDVRADLRSSIQIYAAGITEYPLRVKPIYEEAIPALQIFNGQSLTLSIDKGNDFREVHLTIRHGMTTVSQSISFNEKNVGEMLLIDMNRNELSKWFTLLNYEENIVVEIDRVIVGRNDERGSWTFTLYNSRDFLLEPQEFSAFFGDGDGTETQPYGVNSARHLTNLSALTNAGNNFTDKHFSLKNNLSNIGAWSPIGNNNGEAHNSTTANAQSRRFAGVFDGGGFTISGYVVFTGGTNTYGGLFGYIAKGGGVYNLNVDGISVDGRATAGTYRNTYHGGITGVNSGTVDHCKVLGGNVLGAAVATASSHTMNTYSGGIAGYMFDAGKIINCSNSATIDGWASQWTFHGGVVGASTSSLVSGCTNFGIVRGTCDSLYKDGFTAVFHGGIAGANAGHIVNCSNSGAVRGTIVTGNGNNPKAPLKIIGGMVGYMYTKSGGATAVIGYNFRYNNVDYPVSLVNCTNSGQIENSIKYYRQSNGYYATVSKSCNIALVEIQGNQRMLIAGCGAGVNRDTIHWVETTSGVTNLPGASNLTIVLTPISVVQQSQFVLLGADISNGNTSNSQGGLSSGVLFALLLLVAICAYVRVMLYRKKKETAGFCPKTYYLSRHK